MALSGMRRSDGANYRIVELDVGSLPMFGQFAWLVYCAYILDVAGQSHTIVLSCHELSCECERFARSYLFRQLFPSTHLTTAQARRIPDPATDFAYVVSSEALSRKVLACFDRVFLRPFRLPRTVDTCVYWDNAATGRYFDVLSKALSSFDVPGAEAGQRQLKKVFGLAGRVVTMMTSIHNGDRYLKGFLENVSRLQHYEQYEHYLVRAASPGSEHDALLQHVQNCPAAAYINLANDPGLYGVWNLIACLASGRYLTSANLDDRRSPVHPLMLCSVLEWSGVDVASTALRVTTTPNLAWEKSEDCDVWYVASGYPKGRYSWTELIDDAGSRERSRNLPHCMPVWRRTLHGAHGLFRETLFGPSSDWEFWLRSGKAGAAFYLLAEPLGLYLKTAQSYWTTAAGGKDFDSKILALYRHESENASGAQYPEQPLSPEALELHCFARTGAYFGLFHRLVCLTTAASRNARLTAALAEVIDVYAARYFGITAFCEAIADSANDVSEPMAFEDAVDLALRFLNEVRGSSTEVVRKNWLWMLADGFESTNGEELRAKLESAASTLTLDAESAHG